MDKQQIKRGFRVNIPAIAFGVILIIYSISLIAPIYWAVISSLKTNPEFLTTTFQFPKEFQWSNYKKVFGNLFVGPDAGMGRMGNTYMPALILNSLLYALGTSLVGAFVPCIVGYAIQRFPTKLSKFINSLIIVTIIIPIVGSQASTLQILNALNLYNKMFSMYIMSFSFCSMYTLIYIGMFKSMSNTYAEAAKMDGAGAFRVFFRIYFPMCIGTFFTVTLLVFISKWNDYYTPLMYIPKYPTLAFALKSLDDNTATGLNFPNMKLAGCMYLLMPILVLFLIFHKRLMTNISIGGIKE